MKILKCSVSLLLTIVITASLLAVSVLAAGGYSINVGGVSFKSEENKSGEGWAYDAASKTLTLNGYSGGPIVSGGDINVVISGNAAVSGTASDSYSSYCCGISVNGALDLTVNDGASVSISGSENTSVRGGDGIVATKLSLKSSASSEFTVSGGDSAAGGGFAIKANSITLNTQNLVAKGGNNSSALYFASSFNVKSGSCATFVAGGNEISAITYLSNAKYEFDGDISSTFETNNSTVYFSTVGQFIYGDINGDKEINAKDSVLLAQHLANWNLGLSENSISAADVFYDGRINAADAVLLAQYLAEWSGVKLGK